jgi:hypothetical protein
MFIFAGLKNTLLHILVNIADKCNNTDKLMRMYVQLNCFLVHISVLCVSVKKNKTTYYVSNCRI